MRNRPTSYAGAVAPGSYALVLATWVLGILGAAFYWWAPTGMVLSLAGVLTGLIGVVRQPRSGSARVLLLCGLVLSLLALGLDLVAVPLNLDVVRFGALRR